MVWLPNGRSHKNQTLIVNPAEAGSTTGEYFRGATTLRDLSGEFAGVPVHSDTLAQQRRYGAPNNGPEKLLTRLVDEQHARAIAADRTGWRPDEKEPAGATTRRRQTVMLGNLVIRHPGASAVELADMVLARYIEPQQNAIAAGVIPETVQQQVIATAMAGMELHDQLTAMSK